MRKIDWVFLALLCVFVVFLIGQQFQLATHESIFEKIVECLEKNLEQNKAQGRINSLIVANINSIYEALDVEWETRPVEQDTIGWETIYGERSESTLDHDPIPPPAGFGARIERSIRRFGWEWKRGDPIENLPPYLRDEATKICTGSVAIDSVWDPETEKWEKTEK